MPGLKPTASALIVLVAAACICMTGCSKPSSGSAGGMQWRFVTNAATVDRNVRSDPAWRYLVFERHYFKGTPGPTAAASHFEVVRLDLTTGAELIIPDSRGGSEPSVSSDGAVLFRRGTRLVLVNPETGKRKSMGLGAEFSQFMRPVISPHGLGVVLIGERDVSSRRNNNDTFTPGQRIYIIDFADRMVKQISKDECPPGVPEDVAWLDDHSVLVRNREDGEGHRIWQRASRIDLDNNSCSLAYFGDTEEGGRWAVNPETLTYAESLPRFGDTSQVSINNFGGETIASLTANGKGGNPSCINEVLLIRPVPRQLVMTCKNEDTKGYNITLIDWRSEHASHQP